MKKHLHKGSVHFMLRLLMYLLVPVAGSSQPFVDLLNVKYQRFPDVPFSVDSQNKLKSNQTEATLFIPLEQKNKDIIMVGGDFTQLSFSTSGANAAHANLFSTCMYLGYDRQLKNEKWRAMALAIPKYNSDVFKIATEDFQMGGLFMMTYKKTATLKYHFGAYYNREFFGDYFIPLIGIDWRVNQRLNVFGDLPNTMNVEYKFGKAFYAGASMVSVISSYRINGSGTPGMYVREGDKNFGHDQVKLFVNAYLAEHMVIFAEAGQTFNRYYELYNKQMDAVSADPVYQRSRKGMFFNVGFAYRYRVD